MGHGVGMVFLSFVGAASFGFGVLFCVLLQSGQVLLSFFARLIYTISSILFLKTFTTIWQNRYQAHGPRILVELMQ